MSLPKHARKTKGNVSIKNRLEQIDNIPPINRGKIVLISKYFQITQEIQSYVKKSL